jgi:hypothetical protein
VKSEYAGIQASILNPTNGATDGELRLRAVVNGTLTDFIQIDGSGQNIIMHREIDMSGKNITNMADPLVAQDAVTKIYADGISGRVSTNTQDILTVSGRISTAIQDLSGVLSEGNSAGPYTINMNNNKITNLATPTDISDATTKGYVDLVTSTSTSNWSLYNAIQNVNISGYELNIISIEGD